MASRKLLNVAQSLEFSSVDKSSNMSWNKDVAMNFIAYNSVPHVGGFDI